MPSIVKVLNNTTCTVTFYNKDGVEQFKIEPADGRSGHDYEIPGNLVPVSGDTWPLPAKGSGYLQLQINDWDPMKLSDENGKLNIVAASGEFGGQTQEYTVPLPSYVDLLLLRVEEEKDKYGVKSHDFKIYQWPSQLKGDPSKYRGSFNVSDFTNMGEVLGNFVLSIC
ncbi:hypothetical protein TWF718_003566 [Orbilia javanica]|uniref:Uncharacterized protein n=1 Tax=Orbilia javanica TaxID=47235 RepID=A0AAN8R7Q7_9PEZI